MLDVLHFYFEEDITLTSEDAMKAQSGVRVAVYDLYDKKYPYAYHGKKPKSPAEYGYVDENLPYDTSAPIKPFDPKTEPTKAYTPATAFDAESANPFGGILDAPMS